MEFEQRKEKTPVDVDTLYVIDLDRCLLDTRHAQRLLESAAEIVGGVDTDAMREARRLVEEDAGSFNTLGYLRKYTDPVTYKRICNIFSEKAREANLFEPGAAEFINSLEAQGLPYMIMTYGSVEWQTMKLEGIGLADAPHKIIDVKEKGRVLAEYFDEETQTFVITHVENVPEGYHAKHIVLVDDKLLSFIGLPQHARGIHVLPEKERDQVPSQTEGGEKLPNVETVRGLGQAGFRLFSM